MESRTFDLEDNLVECPITKQIMRHPVLASDGCHYELEALLADLKRNNNYSPTTGQIITSVIYDDALKSTLDASFDTDPKRYKQYDKAIALQNLQKLINKEQPSFFPQFNLFGTMLSYTGCCIAMDDLDEEMGYRP